MSDLSGPVGDLPDAWIEAAAKGLVAQAALTQPWDELPAFLRDGYRRAAAAALVDVVPLIRAHIADRIEAERVELRQGETTTAKNQIRIDAHNGAIAVAARVARGGTE